MPSYHTRLFLCLAHIAAQNHFPTSRHSAATLSPWGPAGVLGLECGYCLMIGGEAAVVQHLAPLFAPTSVQVYQ